MNEKILAISLVLLVGCHSSPQYEDTSSESTPLISWSVMEEKIETIKSLNPNASISKIMTIGSKERDEVIACSVWVAAENEMKLYVINHAGIALEKSEPLDGWFERHRKETVEVEGVRVPE